MPPTRADRLAFGPTVERVCKPLARRAAELRGQLGRTVVVGLCGAQGSGKSTISAATCDLLQSAGLTAVPLSLDDLYMDRATRADLARTVHPLLATRGPPGTHSVNLGHETLEALAASRPASLPVFDKATDEPLGRSLWPIVESQVDIVIFEGWCVGSAPQPVDLLKTPVNPLERDEDPGGVWRGFVNDQLAGPYQALFARLDALVFLKAPSFEVVRGWRGEAEAKLRARTDGGMSDAQLDRFIAHYERLTRWTLSEMPARAHWTIPLGPDRTPLV